MHEHESDGMGELAEGGVRAALTAAGHIAEQRARQREREHREQEAKAHQEIRQLRHRHTADERGAEALCQALDSATWWDTATVATVAEAWEAAKQYPASDWSGTAQEHINRQLRERHGIDVSDLTDSTAIRVALQGRSLAGDQAASDRRRRSRESADADVVMAAAPVTADQAQEAETERAYDTAERREQMAERLGASGERDGAEARKVADTNFARPADLAARSAEQAAPSREPAERGPHKTRSTRER